MRQEEGRSVREIARLLGVSRSSVSLWVRDVAFTEAQHAALRARDPRYDARRNGSFANVERGRSRRHAFQERGRRLARKGDALYIAGCMLYWAEGDKARNSVRLANSDPALVRYFVAFLRAYFAVEDERFRVTCNLFADHEPRQREIEQFWLETLSLSPASLCKSIINRYSRYTQKKRKNNCRTVRAGSQSTTPRSFKRSTARSRNSVDSIGRSGSRASVADQQAARAPPPSARARRTRAR